MKDKRPHKISDEMIAAFLDGNARPDEVRAVLDSIGDDTELSEILALSSKIDAEAEKIHPGILPMYALAAANSENLCSFDCETFILEHLGFDIDNWSLLETAKANHWVREDGTPLHLVGKLLELKGLYVRRTYDSTIRNIRNALDEGLQVIAVIDAGSPDSDTGNPKPTFHAIYITEIEDDGDVTFLNLDTLLEETIGARDFIEVWRKSGNYLVTASEDTAGYDPQPIDVADIELDANLEELTEAIAENAHDIWARARMDEGWTYGPVRDDAKKQHPDLVPYTQLPDSEKEYDRIMAMNTLRLVRRLGYDIINSAND